MKWPHFVAGLPGFEPAGVAAARFHGSEFTSKEIVMCLQVDEELLALCADLDRMAKRNGLTRPNRGRARAAQPRLRWRPWPSFDPRFANDPDPNWQPL